MRFAVLLLFAAISHGQSGRDPNAVLEQARAKLQEAARTLAQYDCVETVNRSYYQRTVARSTPAQATEAPGACSQNTASRGERALESTDRVRLEVTVSSGRELHSWPGATRFDTRDVDELIRDGPVSTGAFSGYLGSIFDHPDVIFHYVGERAADGKTLFEYGFQVPVGSSHFEVKTATEWKPTAYEGEIQVDPQSLELVRLTIRTTGVPGDAAFCSAEATLNYERVHIGDNEVLLPRQSQLDIVLNSGKQTRNVTTFASCREYTAESEIVFDGSATTENAATQTAGRGRVTLPIGLPVTLALTTPIDTDTAAAGDPIVASVVRPVRRAGSTDDLVPAGAVVKGRIRRVEHHLYPKPYFLIALAFNRVEVQGATSFFVARHEADPALADDLGANLELRDTGIWYWGVGTFLFPTNKSHTVMPKGFESKWFTLATGR
jgi:hypothetical protein